jgi:hypothetical protein
MLEKCAQGLVWQREGRKHLEDLGVDGDKIK